MNKPDSKKIDISGLSKAQVKEILRLVLKFRLSNGLGLSNPIIQDLFYRDNDSLFLSFINNKDGKEK